MWSQGNFVVDPVPGGGLVDGPDFTVLAFYFGFSSPVRTADWAPGSLTRPLLEQDWLFDLTMSSFGEESDEDGWDVLPNHDVWQVWD